VLEAPQAVFAAYQKPGSKAAMSPGVGRRSDLFLETRPAKAAWVFGMAVDQVVIGAGFNPRFVKSSNDATSIRQVQLNRGCPSSLRRTF